MLRQISEEVRVNLKDGLRDIRQGVRQHRHDSARGAAGKSRRPPFPIGEIEGLLGHAAAAFDDAMSIAETLVPRRHKRLDGATPHGLAAYFGGKQSPMERERAFRRDLYYLARAVLAKRGMASATVHEMDLAAVHAAMRDRHAAALEALASATTPEEQIKTTAAVSAALLIALLDRHPIRFTVQFSETNAASTGMDRSAEIGCFAPVALACGLATLGADDMAGNDLLEIALLAADVRHDRIVEACGRPDAAAELASIFGVLLAHLP